jgi:uncharacterized protein YeeX (DUF496 family)
MNRLVIIGNGFDLAHSMKTSYYDFIHDYIIKACQMAQEKITYEDVMVYVEKNSPINQPKLDDSTDIKTLFYLDKPLLPGHMEFVDEKLNDYLKPFIINFKNSFIEKIFTQCHQLKWVDIENEFYEELKKILNNNKQTKAAEIRNLNINMKFLINELGKYMHNQKSVNHIRQYEIILKEKILVNDLASDYIVSNVDAVKTLILNFNYTKTIDKYLKTLDHTINFIHGEADCDDNPIIFGFGDEIDSDYKKLENEKVKGFLEYIKSFGYFKTSNYHNLIRFINSDIYQVYIIGHSCGLSDRTMLNMIFEHDNCKSIKIFYHGDKINNNYTELTQEISRHFTNKGKMRERIVSFDKSFPMPQFS